MTGVFYGWRIVGVAALAQAVSVGTTFYAYGAFLKPIAAEFGASRLAVTLGISLLTIVQGMLGPFLGRALDRGGPRRILLAGVLIEAAGLALLSQAETFWQVALLFVGLVGVGSYFFSPLATITVVAAWFVRMRGRAVGFATVGSSAGGVIFPLLCVALIESLGWRGALLALSGLTLGLALPIARVLVGRPEDIGLLPDGLTSEGLTPDGSTRERLPSDGPSSNEPADLASAAASATSAASERAPDDAEAAPISTRQVLGNRNFWGIAVTIGITYLPVTVLLAHLHPYATDLGLSPARASTLLSSFAFASAGGRLVFGSLADRLDKPAACALMIAALGVGWLGLLREPGFARLLAASTLCGLATGGVLPLWSALVGAAFGRVAFGRAMGLANLLMLPLSVSGAPIAAHLFDETGSYALPFTAFLVCIPIALLALLLLRLPKVEPGLAATR